MKHDVRLKKKLKIVLLVLFLAASGILGFLFGFRVTEIEVEGNIYYTDEEIRELFYKERAIDNTLILSLTQKEVAFQNMPFLNSIEIRMTGKNSIRIHANEKSVVGYVECDEQYWYFNRAGIVVEQCDTPMMTAEERIAKEENERQQAEAEALGLTAVAAELTVKNYVPEVRGFSFEEILLGEQLPVKDADIFNALYSINQMMNKDNIPADFVLFDKEYNISLYYGSVQVLLGQDDHLEEKMTTLASILPEMGGLSGKLHLENYSNNQNGVVFEKDEE